MGPGKMLHLKSSSLRQQLPKSKVNYCHKELHLRYCRVLDPPTYFVYKILLAYKV